MRTTVTLEPDVVALIEKTMRTRGISFKRAVNDAIRAGLLRESKPSEYTVQARSMGTPTIPLTKALQLAAEMEDEEIVRKAAIGK